MSQMPDPTLCPPNRCGSRRQQEYDARTHYTAAHRLTNTRVHNEMLDASERVVGQYRCDPPTDELG